MRSGSLKIIIFFFCVIATFNSHGQVKPPDFNVGLTSVTGFGDQAPFWVISNRQGKYLQDKHAGSLELGIFSSDTGNIADYEYGLELYGRMSRNEDMWIHQAYAGVTLYDLIRFRAGMWEEIVGSKEPSISTGSIIWSGNARPVTRLQLGTPGYLEIPFTGGLAEIKGSIAHGWFEEGRYAADVWLHHKNAYLRFGGDWPVNIYYGFNHYAQWGGSSPRQEEPYPSGFDAFLRVLLNRRACADHPGSPEGWVLNKLGNSVGSRNHGIDVNLDGLSFGVYLQDVFDDGSGMRRMNFPDGLWGAWLRFGEEKKTLQAVVYEFLHTTHQSGPYHDVDGEIVGGNDNYFNHWHYRSGWTYYGYTIGTPLITSTIFNEAEEFRLENTRVIAHHIGFNGYLGENLRYRNLLTFSRNFGTYDYPYEPRRDQVSWVLELSGPLNIFNLEAGITLAADFGDMYGDNFGVMVKLLRRGILAR